MSAKFKVKGTGIHVMTIYQKPGDEGAGYTLLLHDGSEVTIGDAESDYWTLADIIDRRFAKSAT